MDNGWWASSRREEDANFHVEFLKSRNERYSPRVIGFATIWALLTVGLILMPLHGVVVLAGSAGIAVVLSRLAKDHGTT